MKRCLGLIGILFLLIGTGCTPFLIGAGAAGGYKVGTDKRSVGQMWDDGTITAKVKTVLLSDRVTKAYKIDVDTVEKVVTLTGVVTTDFEAKRAAAIAEKVPYVKEVRNFLQIGKKTFGESFDDRVLGTKIKVRLIGAKGIRSLNIDVDVHRSEVTLTGVVATDSQKERVLKIARTTEGTVKVIDNIRVKKRVTE